MSRISPRRRADARDSDAEPPFLFVVRRRATPEYAYIYHGYR